MKQKLFWPKLIGTALLLHLALILLSIIEVVIYSFAINPGHEEEFYEAHAQVSAPWISYIFGSLFIFLLVRRFVRKFEQQQLLYALALPLVYAVIDYALLAAISGTADMMDKTLLIGKALKLAAGLLAYFIYTKKNKTQEQVAI